MAEVGLAMYDAVAYYKHRAEGELSNSYAYFGSESRAGEYHVAREMLWCLDAALSVRDKAMCIAINFLRQFGVAVRVTMRRYRFCEEGLTIGRPEDQGVIDQTKRHHKLWNRVTMDRVEPGGTADASRWERIQPMVIRLFFPGMDELLEEAAQNPCKECRIREVYGAEGAGKFGGVELCDGCRQKWRLHMRSFPMRAAKVFPCLRK
jgi:hypothetical protein